uniref:Uncharacterized protein n=1 Tax=Rhizophora mucronata TaxID=61149 RepID=A0A2P2NE91_RHIMU
MTMFLSGSLYFMGINFQYDKFYCHMSIRRVYICFYFLF